MSIGFCCLVTLSHLFIDGCQHVVTGTASWIKGHHLICYGERLIIAAHIEVEAGKFSVTRCIARIFIYSSLLLHQAAHLIIHTLANIKQVIGGIGVIRVKNKSLSIRLNRVLVEVLSSISITYVEV